MAHDISKYGGFGTPVRGAIEDTYTQAVADASGTAVKGSGWTAGMTLKAHNDSIAENAALIAGLYPITFVGANTTSAAANVAIASKPTHVTPAEGDKIVFVTGEVTATGAAVAAPALVAAATSDGVVIGLVDDTTIKVRFGKDSGADLSANTYTAWVKPA